MVTEQAASASSRGLLLVRARPEPVATWVRRGLVAARVVPLEGWTAVCPAEPTSRAAAPYDDALSVLAARSVKGRLRPALGFFVIGGRAVVTVQPRGWASPQRWMVWSSGRGVMRTPHLAPLGAADLVRAATRSSGPVPAPVTAALARRGGTPATWVAEVMTALRVPGAGLLSAQVPPGATLVEPDWRSVAGFDALMAEEARLQRERGVGRGLARPGTTGGSAEPPAARPGETEEA